MADTIYPSWAPSTINAEFNHKASEANDIGDLAWYDSATPGMRKASTFTDAGTAAATQAAFAALFAGTFRSKQLASDATARNARVEIDQIYEFPCASSTFAVGDYVAPTYTAGVLSNQEVTKVTDPSRAIGRVVKLYASATAKVKVRLTSPILIGVAGDEKAPGTLGAAVAASTAVTNTVTETAFDNLTFSIPANTLKPGDVIRVRLQVIATATNGTDTLDVQLRLGTTDILTTGAVDVANNDIAFIDADIVIRTIGAGGTMVATGLTAIGVPNTVTAKPRLMASAAIDTTAAISVNATATWSVANAGNSCRCDVFNVQVIPARY